MPFESLLIGAWLTLTLAFWVIASGHRQVPLDADIARRLALWFALRISLAEVVLGGFLCILTIRRRAHGMALLLPFITFLMALLLCVVWLPMQRAAQQRIAATANAKAAGDQANLATLRHVRAGVDLAKLLGLIGVFVGLRAGRTR